MSQLQGNQRNSFNDSTFLGLVQSKDTASAAP